MPLRSLLISCLSLLLIACSSDEATELVERYAYRTGNAIDVDIDLTLMPAAQLYAPLAPRRERTAEVPEIREGLLDLIDLRHCNLMQLASERNTSLGRVAKPSQRLIYELKILPGLRHCIAKLDADEDKADLKAKLLQYADTKRQGFASLLLNAIYNSDEMERHFSLGQPPLTPGDQGYLTPLVEPLEQFSLLTQLSSQPNWQTPEFTDALEQNFEKLYRSDFGARWISSMALLTQTLNQSSSAIETRLEGRPICPNGKQNRKSEILWNVFLKFYVGELQPYIAQVEREGKEWTRLHSAILLPLSEISQARLITPYFDVSAQSTLWGPYLAARQRHTEAWQTLLDQCGLRPGA